MQYPIPASSISITTQTETSDNTKRQHGHSSEQKDNSLNSAEDFFWEIEGHPDLKQILMREIASKSNSNICLIGGPGTGKSLFLYAITNGCYKSYYMDAANSSGAGIVEYMINNHKNLEVICLDEIDKLNKREQTALYNLMENGTLTVTKTKNRVFNVKFPRMKIFATSNSTEKMSKPLKSRFSIFELPEYDYPIFERIATRIFYNRYGLSQNISIKVADKVWNVLKSKDVRDLLKIGRLVKPNDSENDIEFLISTYLKYKPKEIDYN